MAANFFASIPALIIVALSSALLVWLHIGAVRTVYLENTVDTPCHAGPCFSQGKVNTTTLLFGLFVLLMGFLRGPLTDICAHMAQVQLEHAPTHVAFALLFGGAFITAIVSTKYPQY